jgi:hypothetical protein
MRIKRDGVCRCGFGTRLAAVVLSGILLSSCAFETENTNLPDLQSYADTAVTDDYSAEDVGDYTSLSSAETDSADSNALTDVTQEQETVEYPEPYGTTLSAEFFLQNLSDAEREVYDELYSGIFDFSDTIDVTDGVILGDDFNDFLSLVTTTSVTAADMDSNYKMYVDENGFVTKIEVTYTLSRDEGAVQYYKLTERAKEIADSIDPDLSDYDKIKLIHDEIVKGCEYDEDAEFPNSAYGSLCDGGGMCESYSKAFTLLCDLVGIESVPVTGTATDEDGLVQAHIWNKVLADGVWYNVDCTWDDPTGVDDSGYVRYDYFMVCDADMAVTHSEDYNRFMTEPVAWNSNGTYFIHEGLTLDYYTDAYAAFEEQIRICFEGGNPDMTIRFRCIDEQVLEYVKQLLFDETDGEKGISRIMREYMSEGQETCYVLSENKWLNIITVRLKNK